MTTPPLTRTSSTGILSPYRWGAHKWEDYLFDTQALIYSGAHAQLAATDLLRDTIQAGNSRQAQLLAEFTAYASDARIALEKITDRLDGMSDTLVTGFTTLDHRLKYHGQLLESIATTLDRVVFALENPLDTVAKELFQNARLLLKRQLYPEALADLRATEAKRPVNPLLQLHLAQIHYHVHDASVPFDYAVAERHISLAMRYARALQPELGENGISILDLVSQTAAHIAIVKGGDAANGGDAVAARRELLRAESYLAALEEPSSDSYFLAAQVAGLLGNTAEAVERIRALADFDRAWIPRSLLQPEFTAISEDIGNLAKQLKIQPGPHSLAVHHSVKEAETFLDRATRLTTSAHNTTLRDTLVDSLAAFEAGSIDATSAHETISAQWNVARNGIRTELNDAIANTERIAQERDADAAKLNDRIVKINSKDSEEGILIAAVVVAAVVGLVVWFCGGPFWMTAVVVGGLTTVGIGIYLYNEHKELLSRRTAEYDLSAQSRSGGDAFKHSLVLLSELEKETMPGRASCTARTKSTSIRLADDLVNGSVYVGKVVSTTPFGAFVELASDVVGLVHISELAATPVERVEEVVRNGDIIDVKMIERDDRGRIRLSMKALMS